MTTNRDDLSEPQFLVDQRLFDTIQRDFDKEAWALEHLLREFMRGKIEPLNKAAEEEDARRKATP